MAITDMSADFGTTFSRTSPDEFEILGIRPELIDFDTAVGQFYFTFTSQSVSLDAVIFFGCVK